MSNLKVRVLTQDEAIPAAVLAYAPSAQLIHIGCHGVTHPKPIEKLDPPFGV
ncbi:MAG: hypothetical protein QRY72_01595 [Candidatus Rhabdochlamydia sp.]